MTGERFMHELHDHPFDLSPREIVRPAVNIAKAAYCSAAELPPVSRAANSCSASVKGSL